MKYKLLLIGLLASSAAISLSFIYVVFLGVHHFIGPEHRQSEVTSDLPRPSSSCSKPR